MKYTDEELLKKYANLAKKLGKMPSQREVIKFICASDTIVARWGKFNSFKVEVIKEYPWIEELEVPARLETPDVESYRLSLEEQKRLKGNSKLIADVSTLDYIEQFAAKVFSGRVQPHKTTPSNSALKRTHTLVLSDLHIGSDLLGRETGAGDFGVIEESRRLAKVVQQAASYKEQYRKNTKLVILLLGDIIENQMHDARTGATIAEQCARAIHLLSQTIAYLATAYPEVEVECQTGNHGRNTSRHKERAVHQKFDSLETIIYYGVKCAVKNLKNVKFNIPRMPLSHYTVYGMKIGITHGDTVIKPGNPGTALNTKSMENQVNRINAALPDKEEYSAIVYGHTHTAHIVHLTNGCTLIGNGSLPPPDHFAVSIGILESNNGQYIFESVPGHAVGDFRLIKAGRKYDKDSSLDKILQPWKDF